MSVAPGEVRLEIDATVAWITLDRPDRLNALAGEMRTRLAEHLEQVGGDPGVRVIVITGAGRGFCAGADVDVMGELLERGDKATFAGLVRAGARVVRALRAARQPVIAGVNGVAAGAGASLAAACDVRALSDAAVVGFTFNRIGLHPDWGATHFLPRLVGAGRAADLILSARMLAADEAHRIGFAQHVFPADEFEARLRELAADVAARPPLALMHAKRTLGAADADLDAALIAEEQAQLACFRSADVREGLAAFREKRSPRFVGR